MKKTLIALMALAGVAGAEDWTATFTSTNSSTTQTWKDYSVSFADINSPLALTITGMDIVAEADNQHNGTYTTEGYGATSIRPNVNVGNGGSWTLNLSLTNKANEDILLSAITLNAFTYNSGGSIQGTDAVRTVDFDITGAFSAENDYTFPGSVSKDVAMELDTPIIIAAGKTVSFSLSANQHPNSLGTFVGLNSASFSTKSIPEPTTATLSLLALAGLAARRRRR